MNIASVLLRLVLAASSALTLSFASVDSNPAQMTYPWLKVGAIGDSKSDYSVGARKTTESNLRQRHLLSYINTSNGRSIHKPGFGTAARSGSGLQVMHLAK